MAIEKMRCRDSAAAALQAMRGLLPSFPPSRASRGARAPAPAPFPRPSARAAEYAASQERPSSSGATASLRTFGNAACSETSARLPRDAGRKKEQQEQEPPDLRAPPPSLSPPSLRLLVDVFVAATMAQTLERDALFKKLRAKAENKASLGNRDAAPRPARPRPSAFPPAPPEADAAAPSLRLPRPVPPAHPAPARPSPAGGRRAGTTAQRPDACADRLLAA